jgi:hypothetical protein
MNIYIIIVPSKEVIETKLKQQNNIVKKSKNVVLTHFDREKTKSCIDMLDIGKCQCLNLSHNVNTYQDVYDHIEKLKKNKKVEFIKDPNFIVLTEQDKMLQSKMKNIKNSYNLRLMKKILKDYLNKRGGATPEDSTKECNTALEYIIENYDNNSVNKSDYYKNFNIALNNCKELSDIHSVAFFVAAEDKDVSVDAETFS